MRERSLEIPSLAELRRVFREDDHSNAPTVDRGPHEGDGNDVATDAGSDDD